MPRSAQVAKKALQAALQAASHNEATAQQLFTAAKSRALSTVAGRYVGDAASCDGLLLVDLIQEGCIINATPTCVELHPQWASSPGMCDPDTCAM